MDNQQVSPRKKYTVSRDGRIMNNWTGKLVSYRLRKKDGYYDFHYRSADGTINRTLLVHRVIASRFVPNPENKPQVNHKDGNKLNNHYLNLEWVTSLENIQHSWKIGSTNIKGEKNHNSVLTAEDIHQIKGIQCACPTLGSKAIAEMLNLNPITVNDVIRGNTWQHLTQFYSNSGLDAYPQRKRMFTPEEINELCDRNHNMKELCAKYNIKKSALGNIRQNPDNYNLGKLQRLSRNRVGTSVPKRQTSLRDDDIV